MNINKVIMTCVGYSNFLLITLPRILLYCKDVTIITSPDDKETQKIQEWSHCKIVTTDAFYRNKALFNKGLAIEEELEKLDNITRWILIIDADIFLPWNFKLPQFLDICTLYGCRRRDFITKKKIHDGAQVGYFQLFHSSFLVRKPKPWYGIGWKHAGGGDTDFYTKFGQYRKWLDGQYVLHIGEVRKNWCGIGQEHLLKGFFELRKTRGNYDAERV